MLGATLLHAASAKLTRFAGAWQKRRVNLQRREQNCIRVVNGVLVRAMDLDSSARDELARALRTNRLVLFLGAGFSTDATNKLGESIPVGETFCRKLWSFLRL